MSDAVPGEMPPQKEHAVRTPKAKPTPKKKKGKLGEHLIKHPKKLRDARKLRPGTTGFVKGVPQGRSGPLRDKPGHPTVLERTTKRPVTVEQVEALALIHCTEEEMAHVLDIDVDTLIKHFSDVIVRARGRGKMSLRRKQFEVAHGREAQPERVTVRVEGGKEIREVTPSAKPIPPDPRMLMFLGQQVLEQRDYTRLEATSPAGKPVQVEDVTKLTDEEAVAKIAEIFARAKRRRLPGL